VSLPHGSYTQVAFVTHDLDRAVDNWVRTLGAGPFYVFDSALDDAVYRGQPNAATNRAAMGFLGATNIEFFEPTNDAPSMYREILDAKGESSLQHTLPAMRPVTRQEFDALCAGYESKGLEVAYSGTVPDMGPIRFYDALDQLGQFIEACMMNDEIYRVVDRVYEAHADWDGQRAVRQLDELFAN
jgi:hypothetical protein